MADSTEGMINALLFSADDPDSWLRLPPDVLARAAKQLYEEGVDETGILIDPTTGKPYIVEP